MIPARLIALAIASCGTAAVQQQAPAALASAGSCAGLAHDACVARASCFWWVNTRPCLAGAPCEPDKCVDRASAPADTRVSCGCAAQGTSAPMICVRAQGSTATTCEAVPAGCPPAPVDATDAQTAATCACLSQAGRTCTAASDVRSLCDCR